MTEAQAIELAAAYRSYIVHLQECTTGCRTTDTICPTGEELRAAYQAAERGAGG
ncbi:hypothetical protein [Streptomyces nitrosporeus]|uniref:hypothetical protein n=1 Tax=Streptomyces nitrosporeus TaxID=28894 RepID=UPI00142F122A|nr:hypothetical protein [Streptomyces nitrosporeus]GGY84908.1 hypothetical protein GCM10010327_14150 [Streptomyces nitrosporeus]